MRPKDEQSALRDVDVAIAQLAKIRKLLLDVFALDDQPSGHDTFDDGEHSGPRDSAHEQALRVVGQVKRIAQSCKATATDCGNLTSRVRAKR